MYSFKILVVSASIVRVDRSWSIDELRLRRTFIKKKKISPVVPCVLKQHLLKASEAIPGLGQHEKSSKTNR